MARKYAGVPSSPRSTRGPDIQGALVLHACQYCGDDVLAPEEADTVTCGTCTVRLAIAGQSAEG
jgi:uncharacterized membrane protein